MKWCLMALSEMSKIWMDGREGKDLNRWDRFLGDLDLYDMYMSKRSKVKVSGSF